jgi:hypothetical protein
MTRPGSFVVTLFAIVPCTPAALGAQELALARAIVDSAFTVRAEARGVAPASSSMAARTEVTNGMSVQCFAAASSADVHGWFQRNDQSLVVQLTGSCVANGFVAPAAAASVGQPSVLVELNVPHAMAVRFTPRATAIVGPGSPPVRSTVDVGADGTPELDFVSRAGLCATVDDTFVLHLPAGAVVIRLALDVELPAVVGNQALCSTAGAAVQIEPAHATGSWEGPSCGSFVEATPMLDGTNVRFWVGHPYAGSLGMLVLGASPAAVAIPQAPWCSLLVTPDVVLPMSPTAYTMLPLGALGPGELFAQGVLLQPSTPWQPAPQLFTSARLRMQLR